MDRIAEKFSDWFGSAPFILLHAVWWVLWFSFKLSLDILLVIVSLEAIILSLFILRAENVQSRRTEKAVIADLKESRKQMEIISRIEKAISGTGVNVKRKRGK